MDCTEKIREFLDARRGEFLDDLRALIRINSVRTAPAEGKPFGEGPAAALEAAARVCGRLGLECENDANYALAVRMNSKPEALGILAHLDTVEAGEGWSRDPFEAHIEDGRIYGRGAADDKGPALAAIYAMAAAKAVCPGLPHGITLVLGSAEETGSEDLRHYFASRPLPPASFSPDADFPLINTEKGGYAPVLTASWEPSAAKARILSVTGGKTNNIVPQTARALIAGVPLDAVMRAAQDAASRTGARFDVSPEDKGLAITAFGKAAHAAAPEKGVNAQTALLSMLAALPMPDDPAAAAVRSLCGLFPHGDTRGKALSIAQRDDISGELTLNFGVLRLDETGFRGQIDIRTPLCATRAGVAEPIAEAAGKAGISVSTLDMRPPHHVSADSPFVKLLLSVYEKHTGKEGKCLSTGGGTYVHAIEGGVAFGCAMPGVDNHMHGPDEFAVTDDLIMSAAMFAEIMIRIGEAFPAAK